MSRRHQQTHSTRVPPLTPQAALPLSVKSRNLLNAANCLRNVGEILGDEFLISSLVQLRKVIVRKCI